MPQLVTAWQGVSRAECQKAFEQAEAQYNNAFQVGAVAAPTDWVSCPADAPAVVTRVRH